MGQAPTERTISLPAGRTAGRGFRNYRVATKLRALDNNYGQVVNGLRRFSAHLRTYGNPIEHCRQSAIFLFFSFQSVCGRKDGPAQFFPGRTRSNLRPPSARPPSLTHSLQSTSYAPSKLKYGDFFQLCLLIRQHVSLPTSFVRSRTTPNIY